MSRFSKTAALIAATAAAALAAPTGASAAVTQTVSGDTLTVTSDEAADTIALAAAGGFITVNGQATTLAADRNAKIVVDAGDGADTVNASALAAADHSKLTVNGGDGDDLLTGGSANDDLRGDGGNDRVIGFRGTDDLEGGTGNDVLVWNNGDGSDVVDGDAGADEVEINGAPTVGDVFTAIPNAGRVTFNRTNLVPFAVDLSAERLTVNGLGGEDTFNGDAGLAPLTLLSLNGGPGVDSLSGGDGPDLITGGDDADKVAGEGGDDRVVGDRGTDTLRGGDGDDTLVWNNGDGSDVSDGDEGFDAVEVNGSPAAGDVLTVRPNGKGAAIDRTNLVPFTVEFTAEALTINGAGGDDQLTVAAGLPGLLVTADGESGNDSLTGAEEADSLVGGAGVDALTGGAGRDVLDGQDGDDALNVRDGSFDLARGGAGTDSARTDQVGVDGLDSVENVDALPGDEPPGDEPPGDEPPNEPPNPEPSNEFSFGEVKKNTKKGTAKLTAIVPGPGELALRGKKVRRVTEQAEDAATGAASNGVEVDLKVKAKGKSERKLNRTGKATVRMNVTYTPTGGEPSSENKEVTLRKRR